MFGFIVCQVLKVVFICLYSLLNRFDTVPVYVNDIHVLGISVCIFRNAADLCRR